ncbi:MAG: YihY/virulence factor BrkB family protein [Betaproteobacteria bacterium]
MKCWTIGELWTLTRRAVDSWMEDGAQSMGAALSYYTIFSLAPLLLIVLSLGGLVFGPDAVRGEIFAQLNGLMGADAAKAIEDLLANVNKPAQGILATVVGIVLTLVGATSVFGELQTALDRIWRAPAVEKRGGLAGLWLLLRTRLLSFGMILGLAFVLMVSLVLGALMAALGKWWGGNFAGWEMVMQFSNEALSFALTTAVFAMIYKLMPRVPVRWQDVWLGALVTAMLFTIGKFLIGLYIGRSGIASGFGAAGSLIIILVWVYYSAQIFLIGAEFTSVYAHSYDPARQSAPQDGTAPRQEATSQAREPSVLAPGRTLPVSR